MKIGKQFDEKIRNFKEMIIKIHNSIPKETIGKKNSSFIFKWDMGKFRCYLSPGAFFLYTKRDANNKPITIAKYCLNKKEFID